jgi:hypothetical protein
LDNKIYSVPSAEVGHLVKSTQRVGWTLHNKMYALRRLHNKIYALPRGACEIYPVLSPVENWLRRCVLTGIIPPTPPPFMAPTHRTTAGYYDSPLSPLILTSCEPNLTILKKLMIRT